MARFKPTRFMAEDSKYNKKTADYAVSFIECLSHTKGTWAGKKFELLDWQDVACQAKRKKVTRKTQKTALIHPIYGNQSGFSYVI